MELLVTGVAGFIGSNFARYVLSRTDWSITGIDAERYSANLSSLTDLDPARFRYLKIDLCDKDALQEACQGIDLVVNFAAESHNDNSISDPTPFLTSNVIGVFNLLEVCRAKGLRLHHVSTDEVFGDLDFEAESLFSEESPYKPSSPYSATKASGDLLVRAWVRTFGISATISNCSNNYGAYQNVEKFIPRQIVQLLSGGNIEIYGDGSHVRDWLNVKDHCDAILEILMHGKCGQTYVIGANHERTNLSIARDLLEIFGLGEDRLSFVADRPGHDRRYGLNPTKMKDELGWEARLTNLSRDLPSLVEWYSENRLWWAPNRQSTRRET